MTSLLWSKRLVCPCDLFLVVVTAVAKFLLSHAWGFLSKERLFHPYFCCFLFNVIYTVTCKSHIKARDLNLIWSSGPGIENRDSRRVCGRALTKKTWKPTFTLVQSGWKCVCMRLNSVLWLSFAVRIDSQLLRSP